VVESLKNKGAIFVEDLSEVPRSRSRIQRPRRGQERGGGSRRPQPSGPQCHLPSGDKVHNPGQAHMSKGRALILIGHAGHPRSREPWVSSRTGTSGANVDDVAALTLPADKPVAYITQTTLSVDDTKDIIAALQQRFTDIQGPDIRISAMRHKTANLR